MSLIRARRERRELGSRAKRPPPVFRLVLLLLFVLGLIWYLSQYT